jgi:hypothetical protein
MVFTVGLYGRPGSRPPRLYGCRSITNVTRVPIKDTMDLLEHHFERNVLGLLRHVLTTLYMAFNGQFYGQTDDVTMGSTLSPVLANFYMEDYEKAALESPPPPQNPAAGFAT